MVVARGEELACAVAHPDEADDFAWTDAQTAAFLASEPLTLGWISQSPAQSGNERAYVCCWVTVDND